MKRMIMPRAFKVPTRLSETWLVETCPKLTVAQARQLIEALRQRGWKDRKGSLANRVYGRLDSEVRAALAAERKAAKNARRN
jgi:hypothetical protein